MTRRVNQAPRRWGTFAVPGVEVAVDLLPRCWRPGCPGTGMPGCWGFTHPSRLTARHSRLLAHHLPRNRGARQAGVTGSEGPSGALTQRTRRNRGGREGQQQLVWGQHPLIAMLGCRFNGALQLQSSAHLCVKSLFKSMMIGQCRNGRGTAGSEHPCRAESCKCN